MLTHALGTCLWINYKRKYVKWSIKALSNYTIPHKNSWCILTDILDDCKFCDLLKKAKGKKKGNLQTFYFTGFHVHTCDRDKAAGC